MATMEERLAAVQSAGASSMEERLAAAQGKTVGGFLGNVVSSGAALAGNAAQALLHPVTTAKNVVDSAVGLAQRALPEGAVQPMDKRAYGNALTEFYKNRYGGVHNIGETLYNDPVGAAADLSALLTGVGGVANAAGLNTVARVAKVGQAIDPLRAMGRAVETVGAKVLQPGMQKLSERIISSNVKMPESMQLKNPTKDVPRIILDNKLTHGERGAEQANRMVEDLSGLLSSKVAGTKGKFSLQPVLDELDRLEQEYLHQPAADGDLAAVRHARQQLLDNPLYGEDIIKAITKSTQVPSGVLDQFGQPVMKTQTTTTNKIVGRRLKEQTATEIDRMKKNVYGGLKGKYGVEKSGVIEADKGFGRGLKRILDDNVPGAREINAKQSDMIVARNALSKMAVREGNKYPIGLMDIGAGGVIAGAEMAGHPALGVAALTAALLKHPTTAFPIAKVLNKGAQVRVPTGPVARTVGRAATPAAVVHRSTRPITKDELERRYAALPDHLKQ